jgi:hypothetical protein
MGSEGWNRSIAHKARMALMNMEFRHPLWKNTVCPWFFVRERDTDKVKLIRGMRTALGEEDLSPTSSVHLKQA